MWSATAEYALRAVLFLARTDSRPKTADVIARSIGAPANYLAKTLNALARAGVLRSARGPAGGFSLAEAPTLLTLHQVIGVFAEPRHSTMCLLRDAQCNPTSPCAAHERWQEITRATRDALETTTLSALLEPKPSDV